MTVDIANELWIARVKLASPGARTNLDANAPRLTWEGYCESIGVAKTTANRWLASLFERDHRDVLATKFTGDQESYTPEVCVEAARKVMGSIDLAPASNDLAQNTDKAKTYYKEQKPSLPRPDRGHKNEAVKAPAERVADALPEKDTHPTRSQATTMFRVSRSKIPEASKVLKARPDLAEKVANGQIALNNACRQVERVEEKKKIEANKPPEGICSPK